MATKLCAAIYYAVSKYTSFYLEISELITHASEVEQEPLELQVCGDLWDGGEVLIIVDVVDVGLPDDRCRYHAEYQVEHAHGVGVKLRDGGITALEIVVIERVSPGFLVLVFDVLIHGVHAEGTGLI